KAQTTGYFILTPAPASPGPNIYSSSSSRCSVDSTMLAPEVINFYQVAPHFLEWSATQINVPVGTGTVTYPPGPPMYGALAYVSGGCFMVAPPSPNPYPWSVSVDASWVIIDGPQPLSGTSPACQSQTPGACGPGAMIAAHVNATGLSVGSYAAT